MLFSEKMANVPQPRRAELWKEYRTLCSALALKVTLRRENRPPKEEELEALRQAAQRADRILAEYGMEPSFAPDSPDFLPQLLRELEEIASQPKRKD